MPDRRAEPHARTTARLPPAGSARTASTKRPNGATSAASAGDDRDHAAYDAEAVSRWWGILARADWVLKRFRGRFLGKASPVHFFWGSFDLATTRFSGRRAPAPSRRRAQLPRLLMTEAYCHECSSVGFWPGSGPLGQAALYSYAYPEPPGYADGPVRPAGAFYSAEMREFVLPYEAVTAAADPDAALLDFCQSTYEIAADCGHWDRASLDR